MNATPAPAPARVDLRVYALVAALALVVSAPSLLNGFAYDDIWIISSNRRVQDLGRWYDWFHTSYWPTLEATLYRPLTTTGYALQWAAGNGTPWIFHAVNVCLYVGGTLALTWVASLMLPARAAMIIGALFAVHPVHVEAVGNGVGQAELSAGLVMLCAMGVYIRSRQRGFPSRQQRVVIGGLSLVAVMLKEHALALPAWFAIAELTLFRADAPMRVRLRALAPLIVMCVSVAALTLVVRWDVLGSVGGEIPHPALRDLNVGERALVMLGALPEIARLLVWPAKLSADYSPQHLFVSTTPHLSQLNGLLVAGGMVVLFIVAWRRSAVAAFGLGVAAMVWLPTSNILFPSGVLVAERTLYLPSAGLLIAAGVLIAWIDARVRQVPRRQIALGAALAVLLVAGAARSIERQRSWRSTADVFLTMVHDAPLSFRAHYGWGGILFERGDLAGGEREWRAAIRLFPSYHHVYQELAAKYQRANVCHAAIPLYQQAIRIAGPLDISLGGLTTCQLVTRRFRQARATALVGMREGRDPRAFRLQYRVADSLLAALDSLR